MDKCRTEKPPLRELHPRQNVACHLYEVDAMGNVSTVVDMKDKPQRNKDTKIGAEAPK
jgi:hypothetical protein